MRWIAAVQFLVCFILLCLVFRDGSCCEQGWLQYDEHCFRIYTEPQIRFIARTKCLDEGSELASISDESVLQYLSAQLGQLHDKRFWVGLHFDLKKRKLSWMDDTPLKDEPWVKDYIPESTYRFTSAHLDCFAYNGTLIQRNSCIEKLGYICAHERANDTTRTVCNGSVDPEGTYFATDRMPWDDAELYCQSYGGHLASFHSLEEEKIGLCSMYGRYPHSYWIGLQLDPETETYKWSDGTFLNYTNWAPGHPDHKDKRLRCVAVEAEDNHWVSSLCSIHSWFICLAPKRYSEQSNGRPKREPIKFRLPTIQMPKIQMPKIDLSKIDLSKYGLPKSKQTKSKQTKYNSLGIEMPDIGEPTGEQPSSGQHTSLLLVVIIFGTVIVLLFTVICVYLRKLGKKLRNIFYLLLIIHKNSPDSEESVNMECEADETSL